jgi:uncharacterized membrane protein required for colicin V production
MGFDLALGAIIALAAIRGWIQGFVSQTVRIGSLIACVYLADLVRERAKPYVLPYLSSIEPDMVDRLMWWVSAVLTYVVLVGFITLVVKMTRRPEVPGIPQSTRNDQYAGFLLGAAKGVLIAAFATAGIQKYASEQIKMVAWADDQVKASWALKWNDEFHPAARIWSSRPVRHFVSCVRRMGIQNPSARSGSPTSQETDAEPAVRTAHRDPTLSLPSPSPDAGQLDAETDSEIKALLKARVKDPN